MMYMSFTETKNILLENSEMARKEGVKQQFLWDEVYYHVQRER